jgi:hypothetical protein
MRWKKWFVLPGLRHSEEFKIAFARHTGSPQIVLDNEDRNCGVPGNDDWPDDTGFGKNHMIAFRTN